MTERELVMWCLQYAKGFDRDWYEVCDIAEKIRGYIMSASEEEVKGITPPMLAVAGGLSDVDVRNLKAMGPGGIIGGLTPQA